MKTPWDGIRECVAFADQSYCLFCVFMQLQLLESLPYGNGHSSTHAKFGFAINNDYSTVVHTVERNICNTTSYAYYMRLTTTFVLRGSSTMKETCVRAVNTKIC